ncbi:MAG: phosphatase PAP2 family protein [Chitinophagales bacterium]|nr:phosphatase PAP2 family protein [Chitinophagales bacterium]
MKGKFIFLTFAILIQTTLSFSQSSSPFFISEKRDIPISIMSGIVFGLGTYSDLRHKKHWMTEAEFESLNRLKVCGDTCALLSESVLADRVSDGLLFGSILMALEIGLLALPSITHDETARGTNAVMILQTFAINQGVTDLFKNYLLHPRPFSYYRSQYPTYSDMMAQSNFGDANRSFFSGHTSTTAAFSFLTADMLSSQSSRQSDKILIWSAGILVPAVTGYLRVKAKKHFPVDVVAGYVTGAAIGFGVAEFHKKSILH